ncbi:TPR and ankyrin repeat-containing protein 1 [Nymphon striatum]|nr:TPR and ankyrin repeat-containing protein 1 [Nymphon striatum]
MLILNRSAKVDRFKMFSFQILITFCADSRTQCDEVDPSDMTAFHVFCLYLPLRDYTNKTKAMLAIGFDPFVYNEDGMLPVQLLSFKNIPLIQSMISKLNDKGIKEKMQYDIDSSSWTYIIEKLMERELWKIVEMFLMNPSFKTPEFHAENIKFASIMEYFKKEKNSPIMQKMQILKKMVQAGCVVDIWDQVSPLEQLTESLQEVYTSLYEVQHAKPLLHTALKIAEKEKSQGLMKEILDTINNFESINLKNYLEEKDDVGDTVLHCTLKGSEGNIKIQAVIALLSFEASVFTENQDGKSCFDLVKNRENNRVKKLILKRGKSINHKKQTWDEGSEKETDTQYDTLAETQDDTLVETQEKEVPSSSLNLEIRNKKTSKITILKELKESIKKFDFSVKISLKIDSFDAETSIISQSVNFNESCDSPNNCLVNQSCDADPSNLDNDTKDDMECTNDYDGEKENDETPNLNFPKKKSNEEIREIVNDSRIVNSEIYGTPDDHITNAIKDPTIPYHSKEHHHVTQELNHIHDMQSEETMEIISLPTEEIYTENGVTDSIEDVKGKLDEVQSKLTFPKVNCNSQNVNGIQEKDYKGSVKELVSQIDPVGTLNAASVEEKCDNNVAEEVFKSVQPLDASVTIENPQPFSDEVNSNRESSCSQGSDPKIPYHSKDHTVTPELNPVRVMQSEETVEIISLPTEEINKENGVTASIEDVKGKLDEVQFKITFPEVNCKSQNVSGIQENDYKRPVKDLVSQTDLVGTLNAVSVEEKYDINVTEEEFESVQPLDASITIENPQPFSGEVNSNREISLSQSRDAKTEKLQVFKFDNFNNDPYGQVYSNEMTEHVHERFYKDMSELQYDFECTEFTISSLRKRNFSCCEKFCMEKVIYDIAKKGLYFGEDLSFDLKNLRINLWAVPTVHDLWLIVERCVSFSPRLSSIGAESNYLYADTLRLWDIVKPMDFNAIVKQVENAYTYGMESQVITQVRLCATSYKKCHYEDEESIKIYPLSKDKYSAIRMYPLTTFLLDSLLRNNDEDLSYAIKLTEKEFKMSQLDLDSAVLLLGRSGTVKVITCYILYILQPTTFSQPLLPNVCFARLNHDIIVNVDVRNAYNCKTTCLLYNMLKHFQTHEYLKEEAVLSPGFVKIDDLKQIFVTRNGVLCSEVQKVFQQMQQSCKKPTDRVRQFFKFNEIPNDYYPLFLKFNKWLLLLDGTLTKPFFPRDSNGKISINIPGWTDQDEMRGLIWLMGQREHDPKVSTDVKMCEMTYEIFTKTIWLKMKRAEKYHSVLVWTEIMAFIKGSTEALKSPNGYLDLNKYEKVGKKRAANFSGDRKRIYEMFTTYNKYLRENNMFDRCDLIYHIYNHVTDVIDWGPSSIYVDEVQDFTDAELSLFIKCVQNPNSLFMTGDTAQNVMKGNSFRFEDLKSLFYEEKQENDKVMIPKKLPYQLRYNYRSHDGILKLASSVLDILSHFFPESFDKMDPDQGLFNGPKPYIIEAVKMDDLLKFLSGNQKEISQIEFGANQAILVMNEERKHEIKKHMKGLILTIYESKGLEFNDILLCNFFTDSKTDREWRHVSSYADFLENKTNEESETTIEESSDIKGSGEPLKFDPNENRILVPELKLLYTALTRAKVNIWIFDEDEVKRKPMYNYFLRRKLVKPGFPFDLMAQKSSPKEWEDQGDSFLQKKYYELAIHAYTQADAHEKLKVAECWAQYETALSSEDVPEKQLLLCKVAKEFFEAEMFIETTECLIKAGEYLHAAFLLEKMKRVS